MSNLPILAALPSGSAADKDLLRAALVRDFIAWIDPDTDPQTVDTSDAVEGTIAPVIAWRGQFFWLDPDDASTAHDGVTCIVTFNSARYLISGVFYPARILDRDLDTPPAEEDNTYGDAYLVPAGASGDWADYEDHVAIWTSRGWVYSPPYDGRLLYISDEDGFVRYALSAWLDGLGNGQHQANSVPLAAMIGAAASLTIRVENQTTTAPPGSAAVGVAYIVGPSATGDWLGQEGKVAICEVADTFTLYAPQTGDKVFDKNLGYDVQWNGSAWVSAAGAIVGTQYDRDDSLRSATFAGSAYYDVNDAAYAAPTTSTKRMPFTQTVTYQAKRGGNRIVINFQVSLNQWTYASAGNIVGSASGTYRRGCIAIYRDSEINAIDYAQGIFPEATTDGLGTVTISSGSPSTINVQFEFEASDADEHTYTIALGLPMMAGYVTSSGADAWLYPATYFRTMIHTQELAPQ